MGVSSGQVRAMRNLGQRIGRVGERASQVETSILSFLIAMIVVIVFFGVIARYAPIAGHTMWTAELARLFLLWSAFWAAGAMEMERFGAHGAHFRVDLIDGVFSGKRQLFLQLFTELVILIGLAIMIKSAIEYSVGAMGTTTYVLQWPWVVRAVPLLFGCLLLFIHNLIRLIRNFRRLFEQC